MANIGIYGGTFDPIHLGHLNLAIDMLEKRNLDEIWFCPAWISPHKLAKEPAAAAHHRLAMLQLAIAGIPQFRILDVEIQRQGPAYTVDTLRELIEQEKSKSAPAQF